MSDYEILGLDLWPGDTIHDAAGALLATVGPDGHVSICL